MTVRQDPQTDAVCHRCGRRREVLQWTGAEYVNWCLPCWMRRKLG